LVGCTESTPKLASLANKQLGVVVDFEAPSPSPVPTVTATLQFDQAAAPCVAPDAIVDLDGVALERTPAAAGFMRGVCTIGYQLFSAAPAAAAQSTLRFKDG